MDEKLLPHEILSEILPGILAEGSVLVKFKTNEETDILPSMILTLDPAQCPIDKKPVDNEEFGCIWCWNVHRGGWYLLNCFDVDEAMNWPPVFEEKIED